MKKIIAGRFSLFAALFFSALSAHAFTLAENGEGKAIIVRSRGASACEIFAARELAEYIGRITGAELPVVRNVSEEYPVYPGVFSNPALALRLPAKAKALEEEIQHDGFALYSDSSGLYVLAKEKRGVLYGVYEILKRYGKVRWIHPGEEGSVVPKSPDFKIPPLSEVVNPSFKYRKFNLIAAHGDSMRETRLWMMRNNMTPSDFIEEKFDPLIMRGGHIFCALLPDSLFPSNPALFGLYGGQRLPQEGMRRQPCTSNPETIRIMCENLKNMVSTEPPPAQVVIFNNDSPTWCECENCVKLDPPSERARGQLPTRYWNLANALINAGKSVSPSTDFFGTAYQNFHEFPLAIKPLRNSEVLLAYNMRCYTHSLFDERCEKNKRFRESFEQFANNPCRIKVYNYYNFLPCGKYYYFVTSRQISGELRELAKRKVLGWSDEVLPWDGMFLDGRDSKMWQKNPLDLYLRTQILWNADNDFDQIEDEAGCAFYRSAWPAMKQYRWHLSRLFTETKEHFSMASENIELGSLLSEYGSEEEALRLLEKAKVLAENDEISFIRVENDLEAFKTTWCARKQEYLASRSLSTVEAAFYDPSDLKSSLRYASNVSGIPIKLKFLYDAENLFVVHGNSVNGARLEIIIEGKKHSFDVSKEGKKSIALSQASRLHSTLAIGVILHKGEESIGWNGQETLAAPGILRLLSFGSPLLVNGDFADVKNIARVPGLLSIHGPGEIVPVPDAVVGKNVLKINGTNALILASLYNLAGFLQNYWNPVPFRGKLKISLAARGEGLANVRLRDTGKNGKHLLEASSSLSISGDIWKEYEHVFDCASFTGDTVSLLIVVNGKMEIDNLKADIVQQVKQSGN